MRATTRFVPLLLSLCFCAAARDVGHKLKKILDIQTTGNNRTVAKIPGYMYELYRDPGNQRYDMIRSISPSTESLGGSTLFVYDLSDLKPTERVEKAVLQLEPNPNYQFSKAINVSIFSLAKQKLSKNYLGTASIRNTLDLTETLNGFQSLPSLNQLIVLMEGLTGPKKPSIGLVLYSKNIEGKYAKGHELAKLLYKTTNKRPKRSVENNEIDFKKYRFTDEPKEKKKKKKGSKGRKLQAEDTGYSIELTRTDRCHMEKLELDFADIGWEDWVIYPKGFETNYCAGGCLFPLGKGVKPTNHATVQSLARSFGRLLDIPEPSCVPDTLAPLTLLFIGNSNQVVLKNYPDMRVVTCSCK